MRLLFAIKSLSLQGGGAERVLAEIAAGLAGRGHELVVASFDADGTEDFYRFDPPIQRIRLGIGLSAKRSSVRQTLRRIHALRREVRRHRPDVAIGFMHSAYIPLGLALVGTGTPVIASEHIVYSHYRDRPAERALLHLIPAFVESVTAISEHMRAGFPAVMRRKMTIVPNPVSAAVADRADARGPEQKLLLTVGRLEEQKDQRTLIAAFAQIAPRFPNWRLRILGEGVLRPELERQIETLEMGNRIELPGALADIGQEYMRAQLFAMPSVYESFGLATAEALAHGLPVVGFADCPGTNELIVNGENGILVEGADRVGALAEGLERLMVDDETRVALAARAPERIAAFAPSRVVDRWEALIGDAVSKRSGKRDPAPARAKRAEAGQ